jgi:hypothetical protein
MKFRPIYVLFVSVLASISTSAFEYYLHEDTHVNRERIGYRGVKINQELIYSIAFPMCPKIGYSVVVEIPRFFPRAVLPFTGILLVVKKITSPPEKNPNMTRVCIPATVEELLGGALSNCGIGFIAFEPHISLGVVGRNCFRGNNIRSICFPELTSDVPADTLIDNPLVECRFAPGSAIQNQTLIALWLACIHVPDSVTRLGTSCFQGCFANFVVFSPNSALEKIEANAFSHMKNLRYIVLPKTLVHIGHSAFRMCESLESVTFLRGAQSLPVTYGKFCCKKTILTEFNAPPGTINIPEGMLLKTRTWKVFIPESVKSIGPDGLASYNLSCAIFETSEYTRCFDGRCLFQAYQPTVRCDQIPILENAIYWTRETIKNEEHHDVSPANTSQDSTTDPDGNQQVDESIRTRMQQSFVRIPWMVSPDAKKLIAMREGLETSFTKEYGPGPIGASACRDLIGIMVVGEKEKERFALLLSGRPQREDDVPMIEHTSHF